MQWVSDYQLFLFDFDGLLVNTEEIHYRAYLDMCKGRGFDLPWNFERYCFMAHYDSEKLKNSIYRDLPELYEMEPDWSVLYQEKKQAILRLLNSGAIHMMPGAEELINSIAEKGIPICVVTNSPDDQIALIKKTNSVLKKIPYWFTRETYTHPKPNPECYLNAIARVMPDAKKIIGFEDTPRGMNALLATPAIPVLVSKVDYPEILEFKTKGVRFYHSLSELPQNGLG